MKKIRKVPISELKDTEGIIIEDVLAKDMVLVSKGTELKRLFELKPGIEEDLKRHGIEWVRVKSITPSLESFSHVLPELLPPIRIINSRFAEVVFYQFAAFAQNIKNKRLRKEGITTFINMGASLVEEIYETSSITLSLTETDHEEKQLFSHLLNVALLSGYIAKQIFPYWRETAENAVITGLFHDIGKILYKDCESEECKMNHPILGESMLREAGVENENILYGVRAHHEKWDGSGHPDRIKNEKIPLLARIVAVANSFCSLEEESNTYSQRLSKVVMHVSSSYDPFIVRGIVSSLGLYPPGSFVELSNNKKAIVLSTGINNIFQPRICLIENGKIQDRIIDLKGNPSLYIRQVWDNIDKKPVAELSKKDIKIESATASHAGYIYKKYKG